MRKWIAEKKSAGWLAALIAGLLAGATTDAFAVRQSYCENNLCNGEEGNCTLVSQQYNCDEVPKGGLGDGCLSTSCGV